MRALRWLAVVVVAEVAVACGASPSPGGRPGAPAPVGFPVGGGGGGGGSGPFTLSLESSHEDLLQGESRSLAVAITATSALTGAVTITVAGLPGGVEVDPLSLTAASPVGALQFHADPTSAAPSPVRATVVATADGGTRTALLDVTVRGRAGAMDLSFGTNGGFSWSGGQPSQARALVVKEDARVYLAGDIATAYGGDWLLLGLDDRGRLRKDFGTAGVARDSFGSFDNLVAAAVPELGEILVGGQTSESDGLLPGARLARFDTGGALDPKFGTGGSVVAYPSGLGDRVGALAGATDGSIYVGVNGTFDPGDGGDASRAFLLHDSSSGSTDPSFGGGAGRVTFPYADPGSVRRLLLRDDGRVLVLLAAAHPAVASLEPNGTADAGFGTGGVLFLSTAMQPTTMCFDHGGIRVVSESNGGAMVVSRVLDDGTPDGAFAEIRDGGFHAVGCRGNPDGSTVIAGNADGASYPVIAKLDATGALDASFGRGGFAFMANGPEGVATGIALDPFGRIVVSGQWTSAAVPGVAAWRAWQ